MNTGGEAAEQIVRMSLEGFEVAAKITGAGAKNIAILLYSILKEEKKSGIGSFLIVALVIGGVVEAGYYFKVVKAK